MLESAYIYGASDQPQPQLAVAPQAVASPREGDGNSPFQKLLTGIAQCNTCVLPAGTQHHPIATMHELEAKKQPRHALAKDTQEDSDQPATTPASPPQVPNIAVTGSTPVTPALKTTPLQVEESPANPPSKITKPVTANIPAGKQANKSTTADTPVTPQTTTALPIAPSTADTSHTPPPQHGTEVAAAPVAVAALAPLHAATTRALAPAPTSERTAATSPAPASTDAPLLLSTTPNVLEVGIATGTHGWLHIRAELSNTGTVSAQLTTSTPATAEHLHKDIPAITDFLAGEHVGLSDLFVRAAERQSGPQAFSAGAGNQGSTPQHDRTPRPFASTEAYEATGMPAWLNNLPTGLLPSYPNAAGGWLSVRV